MGGIGTYTEDRTHKDNLDVQKRVFRNVVTSLLYEMMEREQVSKAELASRLHISKAAVTNLLSGDRNFTIDTLTAISHALGYIPSFRLEKMGTDPEGHRGGIGSQEVDEPRSVSVSL